MRAFIHSGRQGGDDDDDDGEEEGGGPSTRVLMHYLRQGHSGMEVDRPRETGDECEDDDDSPIFPSPPHSSTFFLPTTRVNTTYLGITIVVGTILYTTVCIVWEKKDIGHAQEYYRNTW